MVLLTQDFPPSPLSYGCSPADGTPPSPSSDGCPLVPPTTTAASDGVGNEDDDGDSDSCADASSGGQDRGVERGAGFCGTTQGDDEEGSTPTRRLQDEGADEDGGPSRLDLDADATDASANYYYDEEEEGAGLGNLGLSLGQRTSQTPAAAAEPDSSRSASALASDAAAASSGSVALGYPAPSSGSGSGGGSMTAQAERAERRPSCSVGAGGRGRGHGGIGPAGITSRDERAAATSQSSSLRRPSLLRQSQSQSPPQQQQQASSSFEFEEQQEQEEDTPSRIVRLGHLGQGTPQSDELESTPRSGGSGGVSGSAPRTPAAPAASSAGASANADTDANAASTSASRRWRGGRKRLLMGGAADEGNAKDNTIEIGNDDDDDASIRSRRRRAAATRNGESGEQQILDAYQRHGGAVKKDHGVSSSQESHRQLLRQSGNGDRMDDSDNDEEQEDEEQPQQEQRQPMLSILNLVVDHVMVPPTPLEPEEFNYVLSQRWQEQNRGRIGQTNADGAAAAASTTGVDIDFNILLPSPPPPPPETVMVPVLRFFGPVVRADARSGIPRQSGCLHVHGAYPYLLARPVVAGPDGSSYRRSGVVPPTNNDSNNGGDGQPEALSASFSVNWDDVGSVSLIVDEIHAKLEGALRAAAQWRADRDSLLDGSTAAPDSNNDAGAAADKSGGEPDGTDQQWQQPQTRLIRRVTVVTGRGFYTYCPGPPAPFLRVEYYDPKARWKVKMMLERGLEVSAECHPDPRWYDDDFGAAKLDRDGNANGDGDVDGQRIAAAATPPLKFRCYEAHIPYTMQVFKDNNLAGMSYVKVGDGRFRRSLPKRGRVRVRGCNLGNDAGAVVTAASSSRCSVADDDAALFLVSNVPRDKVWDTSGKAASTIAKADHQHASSRGQGETSTSSEAADSKDVPSSSRSVEGGEDHVVESSPLIPQEEQFWTKNETSCDVEVDTTVHQLLNVDDVMTSLPADPTESEGIHWRAVPSLREIWELERRRMAALLPPKDDFLSHPKPSKAERGEGTEDETPGSDDDESSAAKTPPFTLSVKKGASVPGARLATRGVTKLYDPSPGLEEDYRRALSDIVKRHERFIDDVDDALHRRTEDHGGDPATSDAQRLGAHRGSTSPVEVPSSAHPGDDALDVLNALGEQFAENPMLSQGSSSSAGPRSASSVGKNSSTYSPHIPGSRCVPNASTTSQVAPLTQADVQDLHEAHEFGRSVDRDDAVIGPGSINDVIDPFTLTPFDDHGCEEDGGFLAEEEELGEEGLVRSLSILATQRNAARSNNRLEPDDENKNTSRNLETIEEEWVGERTSSHFGVEETYEEVVVDGGNDMDMDDAEEGIAVHQDSAEEPSNDILAFESGETAVIERNVRMKGAKLSSEQQCETSGEADELDLPPGRGETGGSHLDVARGDILMLRQKAPLRSDCSINDSDCRWHPLVQSEKVAPPPWLHLSTDYNSLRSTFVGPETRVYIECSDTDRNVFMEPVRRPPSSQQISSWLKRRWKRKRLDAANLQKNQSQRSKKARFSTFSNGPPRAGQSTKQKGADLEIDGNSRKLVVAGPPSSKQKKKRVGFADDASFQVFNVEEVEWNDSGAICQQSQSQSSSQNSLLSQNIELGDVHSETAGDRGETFPVKENGIQGLCEAKDSAATHDKKYCSSPKAGDSGLSENPEENLSVPRIGTFRSMTEGVYTANEQSAPLTLGHTASGESQQSIDPLEGIGQQGGRIHVAGGGGLKVNEGAADLGGTYMSTLPSPLTVISIEAHVQCRTGKAGVNDSKIIAMKPDASRDAINAVSYVYGRDPGGGEEIELLERGCIFIPVEAELASCEKDASSSSDTLSDVKGDLSDVLDEKKRISDPGLMRRTLGMASKVTMEMVRNERQLLLRLASIVQWKDPDALLSWDTQGGGLGYIVERGAALGKETSGRGGRGGKPVEMARLLGRTPKSGRFGPVCNSMPSSESNDPKQQAGQTNDWSGSGLGTDWDDRVGAGAAASSIVGRLVFCGWKIIAEEVKHPNASYQPAMVSTILRKRIPHHDDLTLSKWYGSDKGRSRWRVLQHRIAQATATLLLFDALDVIGRAGEAARLSGVEFSQSLPGIRGSQYKVEGVLLRALQSVWSDERGEKKGKNKLRATQVGSAGLSNDSISQKESPWKLRRDVSSGPENQGSNLEEEDCIRDVGQSINRGYFFYSPSKDDCGKQEALECQALTLEPQSGFHCDPVVVCDFTALYPSLIIAYNLCYSTCAGKLDYHSTRPEMNCKGSTTGRLGPFKYPESRSAAVLKHHMKSLIDSKDARKDRAYVVPTGSLFVSETVVKGVLPQVLDEMLSTRAMLKKASKQYKRLVPNISPAILRSLEAKQLALKYVANVTYGYTSATFSGRSAMPLLADAIVECGRRTLTNAIQLANDWGKDKSGRWRGAHVVYGDTDSVFVKLPGRSVKDAFAFGEQFCKAVTASNPPPVQLKLEKVYVKSLLQTKKKYVGMKFESPGDKRPVFEAKGIETVRRDQCALTQKVLRNALITVFQDGVDAAKSYLYRQWALIHAGRLPVSDYILTGRVRSRYRGGKIGPVQAALARRLAEADPGRTVRHKERIPYVIVAAPGRNFRLRDCVLTPTELMEQWDSYTIHAAYYAKKHVNAALQRCLGLAPYKIDVNAWYEASPKPRRRIHFWPVSRTGGNAMITAHFGSDSCALCGVKCKAKGSSRAVVCSNCNKSKVSSAFLAMTKLNKAEQESNAVASICQRCNNCSESSLTFAPEKLTAHKRDGAPKLGNSILRAPKGTASSSGIITPIANCVCIDCPITYERHKLREAQIEAEALCKALDLFCA